MKIRLNQDKPGNLFWFTTDNSVYLNFQRPQAVIERPDLMNKKILKELILAHEHGDIVVGNIIYLKQLFSEAVKKATKKEKEQSAPKEAKDIDRKAAIKAINEDKPEDPGYDLAQLSFPKLKISLQQIANVDVLLKAYHYESQKKHPRAMALKLIKEKIESINPDVVLVEEADDMVVTDEKVGDIEIDKDTGTIKPKDK